MDAHKRIEQSYPVVMKTLTGTHWYIGVSLIESEKSLVSVAQSL